MPIRAITYVSEACPAISGCDPGKGTELLDRVVDDAARFNRDAGVSGVLLFDGCRFLQYMEGPADGLRVAYSRVIGASSHGELIELQRGRVGQRRVPFWPMRWLPVEPQVLSRLAGSDWTGFKQRGDSGALNATAMDILVALVEPHAQIAWSQGTASRESQPLECGTGVAVSNAMK